MSENLFVAGLFLIMGAMVVAGLLWLRAKAKRLARTEVLELRLGASGKGDALSVAAGVLVLAVSAGTLGAGLVKAKQTIGDNFGFVFLLGIVVCMALLFATVFALQRQFSLGRLVLNGNQLELWIPSRGWAPLRCDPKEIQLWGADLHVGCDIQSEVGRISFRYQGISKEDFSFGEHDRRAMATGMPIDRVAGRELFRRIVRLNVR